MKNITPGLGKKLIQTYQLTSKHYNLHGLKEAYEYDCIKIQLSKQDDKKIQNFIQMKEAEIQAQKTNL